MHPNFYRCNPFRLPEWRAERAMQLVAHRQRPLGPRWYDDTYVRTYRNLLLALLAAGDKEAEQQAAIELRPHAYHAHMLHYHPDSERREILQARLLTNEPVAEIATRMSTDESAIEFYEKLFFDVRDRLGCKDWIAKAVLCPPEYQAANSKGTISLEQRGHLYKLFAFFGGPLVLDALVSGIGPSAMPQHGEDAAEWLDDTLGQIVRSRTAAAAQIMQIDKKNIMKLLKLALRQRRVDKAAKAKSQAPRIDTDDYLEKTVAAFEEGLAGWKVQPSEGAGQTTTEGSVEPQASEPLTVNARQASDALEREADELFPAAAKASEAATEAPKHELETLAS